MSVDGTRPHPIGPIDAAGAYKLDGKTPAATRFHDAIGAGVDVAVRKDRMGNAEGLGVGQGEVEGGKWMLPLSAECGADFLGDVLALAIAERKGDAETVRAALLLLFVPPIEIGGRGGREGVASPLDEDTGRCRIVTVAFASCAMFVWHCVCGLVEKLLFGSRVNRDVGFCKISIRL